MIATNDADLEPEPKRAEVDAQKVLLELAEIKELLADIQKRQIVHGKALADALDATDDIRRTIDVRTYG